MSPGFLDFNLLFSAYFPSTPPQTTEPSAAATSTSLQAVLCSPRHVQLTKSLCCALIRRPLYAMWQLKATGCTHEEGRIAMHKKAIIKKGCSKQDCVANGPQQLTRKAHHFGLTTPKFYQGNPNKASLSLSASQSDAGRNPRATNANQP